MVATICLDARVAFHRTGHRLGEITIRVSIRTPTYATSPNASHARRFPANIDDVTLLRGVALERPNGSGPPQSAIRSGVMQIDADSVPSVPILGCEWDPAHPTPPPTANRTSSVRAAPDNTFPPIWRRGVGNSGPTPRLGEESVAHDRSIPYDPRPTATSDFGDSNEGSRRFPSLTVSQSRISNWFLNTRWHR